MTLTMTPFPRRMLLRLVATVAICIVSVGAAVAVAPPDRPIVKVVKKGASYSLVGSRGRSLAVITPPAGSEMVGFNERFCMMRSGGTYLLYNSGGRQYLRIDTADVAGPVKAVSGYTFSAGNDSVTVTYGPDGKVLSLRRHPVVMTDSLETIGQNAEKME